jgi:NADH-quinone oxidoreductase subunit J
MNAFFYITGAVAIVATIMAVTRMNVVHALLYLIVSFLSVAVIFFILGAPFIAAVEVIIYAGAIMVLFVFIVLMFNLGPQTVEQERRWHDPKTWVGPGVLSAILLAEIVYALVRGSVGSTGLREVAPKEVGIELFGPYILGVELASMLLLAGLIGAYHLGRRVKKAVPGKGEDV